MKTSSIEVSDLLSVLTVDDVEKRLGEVPGVESATVNYAARNATVRYDETLLEVTDIKILVHQRRQQSAGESKPGVDGASKPAPQSDDKPEHTHGSAPKPAAESGSASPPAPAVQKSEGSSLAASPDSAQGATPPAPPTSVAPTPSV